MPKAALFPTSETPKSSAAFGTFAVHEAFPGPPLAGATGRRGLQPKCHRELTADRARDADISIADAIELCRMSTEFSGGKSDAAGNRPVITITGVVLGIVLKRIPRRGNFRRGRHEFRRVKICETGN